MKSAVQEDIDRAVEVMRSGGVVLYPTDTVWGIGCDACSDEAVRKVYAIKHRADSKALISLVGSIEQLAEYVDGLDGSLLRSIRESSGRPVTVVFPKAHGLAPSMLAADGSAALRVTGELYSAALCEGLGRPVVSTSANISGSPAPRIFSEIAPEILGAVDYVAQYRRDDTTLHQPSKVIKVSPGGEIDILRP